MACFEQRVEQVLDSLWRQPAYGRSAAARAYVCLARLLTECGQDRGFMQSMLRARLAGFIRKCEELREKLGVIKGDRGFVEGWE